MKDRCRSDGLDESGGLDEFDDSDEPDATMSRSAAPA